MNDDWRLRVDLHAEGSALELGERLEASELEHDLKAAFHDRVVLSIDGSELFCYAGSREQAERVEAAIRSLAAKHKWSVDYELTHWHPSAEEWEDPDKPLPEGDAQRAAERADLMDQERHESEAHGQPEFEVRVQCGSHRDTTKLAEKLREEGLPNLHRWRFLLVGAPDEDSANALAERIRKEAPTDCTVTVEGAQWAVRAEQPFNPFVIFGGLAG